MPELSTTFQILSCRIEVRYDHPSIAKALGYLKQDAHQSVPVRRRLSYRVDGAGPFRVHEEGDLFEVLPDPESLLHSLYARIHRRVLERYVLAGWSVFHGALTEVGGRTLLILGHKGAGKTTLSTRLLFSGHAVDGDELTLVRGTDAIALPRPFHLKHGIAEQIPELEDALLDLPGKGRGRGRLLAFDPTHLGFAWRIGRRRIEQVIWISPNHGGETHLVPRPPFQAIQRVLEASLGWGETRATLVAAATRLGGAGGLELELGSATEAVGLLSAL